MNSTSTTTTPKNLTNSNYPSAEEALYFVEDVMERMQASYMLLGDCARSAVDNLDQTVHQPVEVGVLKRNYTEFMQSMLPTFLPPDTVYTDKKITFSVKDTPVTIRIINRNYEFFKNPSNVYYKITQFPIPNPFDKYWKARQIVQ